MFTPKCVFVTGGAAGIGKGLAREFHKRGAKVIIGGRRESALKATAAELPGLDYVVVDVADASSVANAARTIAERFPILDCLINNAGVQQRIDFTAAQQTVPQELRREIDINFVGLVQTTSAFLPLLMRQSAASIINVSSGLAIAPIALAPVYCATKAAVHSFSMTLRHQLRATPVRVIELAPPLVWDTELHDRQPPMSDEMKKRGMNVAQFTAETFARLDAGEREIFFMNMRMLHDNVRPSFEKIFAMMNGA